MAGIIGASVSKQMSSGDTAVDGAQSGYVINERILLSASPAGSSYTWALAAPSAATGGSELSDTTGSTTDFIPDAAGVYLVTCSVDGTDYTLRLSVSAVAYLRITDAVLLSPIPDASVPTPQIGLALYLSSDADALVVKDSSGDIFPVELGSAL